MKIDRKIPSEATIQAELYMALKTYGLKSVLEQNIEIAGESTRTGRQTKARVDVLLLDNEDNAIACIEVKNRGNSVDSGHFAGTRQHNKYRKIGLPFHYCTTMGSIPATVEWASWIANGPKK